MLRFDAKALYDALDAQRNVRGMTWSQVATETGVSVATITHAAVGVWKSTACWRWFAG